MRLAHNIYIQYNQNLSQHFFSLFLRVGSYPLQENTTLLILLPSMWFQLKFWEISAASPYSSPSAQISKQPNCTRGTFVERHCRNYIPKLKLNPHEQQKNLQSRVRPKCPKWDNSRINNSSRSTR